MPLSPQAYAELLILEQNIHDQRMHAIESDTWSYIWNNSEYTSKKYYRNVFSAIQDHPLFNSLWKSKCTPKIKFFTWLPFNDRLSTRNILRRRKCFLETGYNCVVCLNDTEETLLHLFFDCSFSVSCWYAIGIQWNIALQPMDMIQLCKTNFGRPVFMEIFMIASWNIWKQRNGVIFDAKPPFIAS